MYIPVHMDHHHHHHQHHQNKVLRILVLVGLDVDSLCACKILQYLFQCDHVMYTIVPVSGKEDLERAFVEHAQGMKHVLLLNCGACMDVVEVLQPEDYQIFYICDSHRPVEVHNIYNQVQVKLLMREEELEKVPRFEEVFRDESDEDSGNESDTSDNAGKKKRFDEDAIEKRIAKRKWEEQRTRTLIEYEEFASYGTSSAFLMYEMAWKMSKDTNDLLWLAIIGTTEQYFNEKIDRDKYMEDTGHLQSHVSRLNRRPEDGDSLSVDCLKLCFDQELQLSMYRHWNLFESLCHSQLTASRFKVWTMKGKKKLHEFLAEMGFPLNQCNQKFVSMDIAFKEEVKTMIKEHIEKYGISEGEMFLPSFHAQYGYKNRYCAEDMVHACQAYLETPSRDLEASDTFLQALDVLNRKKTEELCKGVEMAKLQLQAIVKQVQTFVDMSQVISAGPFLYAFVQEGTPDIKFFHKPLGLGKLARFTLEAYTSLSKLKKAKTLPLVLGTPLDSDRGTMLVIGIPPISEDPTKNLFGKCFEQAANSTHSRVMQDLFDTHILELKLEDKTKFFDALMNLLQT